MPILGGGVGPFWMPITNRGVVPEHPLRRLLQYSRPYRGRFGVALLAMLVYAAAQAAVGYLVAPIISKVLPDANGTPFRFWAMAIRSGRNSR